MGIINICTILSHRRTHSSANSIPFRYITWSCCTQKQVRVLKGILSKRVGEEREGESNISNQYSNNQLDSRWKASIQEEFRCVKEGKGGRWPFLSYPFCIHLQVASKWWTRWMKHKDFEFRWPCEWCRLECWVHEGKYRILEVASQLLGYLSLRVLRSAHEAEQKTRKDAPCIPVGEHSEQGIGNDIIISLDVTDIDIVGPGWPILWVVKWSASYSWDKGKDFY